LERESAHRRSQRLALQNENQRCNLAREFGKGQGYIAFTTDLFGFQDEVNIIVQKRN